MAPEGNNRVVFLTVGKQLKVVYPLSNNSKLDFIFPNFQQFGIFVDVIIFSVEYELSSPGGEHEVAEGAQKLMRKSIGSIAGQ